LLQVAIKLYLLAEVWRGEFALKANWKKPICRHRGSSRPVISRIISSSTPAIRRNHRHQENKFRRLMDF
jgi:hypothetical protein